jgi:hypothetical protein
MAYNNYFPGYQPMQMYQPQQMTPPQPQQQTQSSLIWVQGEGAAKSYLVAPGNTVALFDNESQTIYIKSADASGMPSIRILDYTFRDSAPQNKQIFAENDYATKSDVLLLKDEINALRARFDDMEGSKKK